MKAMVLAAGQGTRLRPFTDHVPKPMVPIGEWPVLEHNVRLLAAHGITDLVINLHHRAEVLTRYFGDGRRWGVSITYSREPVLLGTAGAVKNVEALFTETFLVLYGDNLTSCNLGRLAAVHRQSRAVGTIAVYYREEPTAGGIVAMDESDRIVRFLEKPKPEQVFSRWVNAGIYVLEPGVLAEIPAGQPVDFGRQTFPRLLAGDRALAAYRLTGAERLWWIDTPEDLDRVRAEWMASP